MRGLKNQVWVTSAVTDEDVENSMVLCNSLKKTYTSRHVAVIVSRQVNKAYREALNCVFDYVFMLEEDRNTAGLKLEDFAKLFTFTLRSFEKCAFVPNNIFAVKNCDKIFNGNNHIRGLVYYGREASSIVVIRPNLEIFKGLLSALEAKNGHSIETFLTVWARKHKDVCLFTECTYIKNIGGSTLTPPIGNQNDIYFANFLQNPHKLLTSESNLGLAEKTIFELWANVYKSTVEPLLSCTSSSTTVLSSLPNYPKEPIAIIGMSCRYPGANNLEEFWNLLFSGEDATSTPPPFRWLREQTNNYKPECRNTNAGFLKVPVDEFDAKFFVISPKEAMCMDPQHRLMHELVWEGLEDAAINPETIRGTNAAIFMGSWTNDYKDILAHSGNNEFYRCYMGNSIGAMAARISHFLELTGPSVATESGCSSAMVAVHMACRSLQQEETNMALACGVNLLLHPFDKEIMPMVLSPDGHCKTFDATANGFARAEGCGVLVLKRLSDAVRDKDNIWGLIRGTGMSQEGISKSMGTPTVYGESLAMKQALADAQVYPEQITYVESHGTGTPVGDPMEVAAIALAYHSKHRLEPLIIGSVKTNVGHTESCSGITGIMKVILSMHHEIIPAHKNFTSLNPAIDLNSIPAILPLEPVFWKKSPAPRMAGVSSFGITGTDAHAILEEPPLLHLNPPNFTRPQNILKLSAKSPEALSALLDKYANYLLTSTQTWEDFTHTANCGRSDFNHRAILVAKSNKDASQDIQAERYFIGEMVEKPKVCFLFTGQGSQYSTMGQQLYTTSPTFRMHFDYCVSILKNKFNVNILQALWANSQEIGRTIYSQTSIFCVEYALLKLWESWGVTPDYALGHSLGEFAAAVCANILTVEDALMLVANRSLLIDQLPRGKMLVIKAPQLQVDIMMKKFGGNKTLDLAAINSSQQTVVAGDTTVIVEFAEFCKQTNVKCIVLESTHAFHSKHMDPILDSYEKVAKCVKSPGGNDCKYISGTKGTIFEGVNVNSQYWVDHTREKVEFIKASKKAVDEGCTIFVEIGPQPVLSALTMMNNEGHLSCLPSLKRNGEDWSVMLNTLGQLYVKGVQVNWAGVDEFYPRKKISIPHYPFIGKKYWPDMNSVGGASIHPLLGSAISNASGTKLFQSAVNTRAQDYLKDHRIGENIIFPGAGFLEMTLAAGLAVTESCTDSLPTPSRGMKVENLCIVAPLLFHEGKSCVTQTVVDISNDSDGNWNGLSVKICHRSTGDIDTKWVPHATANFSPLAITEEDSWVPIDGPRLQQIIAGADDPEFISSFYADVSNIGLKFGPIFKSGEKVWKPTAGNNSFTSKIKVPPKEAMSNQYLIHPVILDCLIQGIMLARHEKAARQKLCVPLKIGKFVWLAKVESDEIYIHVYDQGATTCAAVMDINGKVFGIISSLEFVETTVKAVEAVLEQQTNSMADLWEEVWRPITTLQCPPDIKNCSEENTWIHFHQNGQLSQYLTDKLTEAGRNVIGVTPSKSYVQIAPNKFHMRKNCEQDFLIFLTLAMKNYTVEGILYTWTLDLNDENSQDDILQPYFYLTKTLSLLNLKVNPPVITITKGFAPLEDNDLSNFHASTIWGYARSLRNENTSLNLRCVDITNLATDPHGLLQLWHQLWPIDKDGGEIALSNGTQYIRKFQPFRATPIDLKLPPASDRFQLILPESKAIADLTFGPMTSIDIGKNEIEVQIKTSALNFRDVFSIMKPSEKFTHINAVGLDFAGVVKKVGKNVTKWSPGDSVFGVNYNGKALPSHITLDENFPLALPNFMTFCEAATLPAVFMTAYYCLIDVAKLTKDDIVLIHTASGGVGLAAIQLCQHVDCTIIVTAGSTRKQNYLQSLGIQHIFHSRNTQYAHDILKVTNGRGVDVVLNSLTSEGFKEATLQACAENARFVEMSKLSIWSEEQVIALRPDVTYKIVDVASLKDQECLRLLTKLGEYLEQKIITPIPYVRYDGVNIREALQYMQKAKHIGKIVCVMPELRNESGAMKMYTPMFNERSTYLITGGLGGIGFEVCKWMVGKGAKYVLVAGRSAPKLHIQKGIDEMNFGGANVIPVSLDVGNFEECRKLIQEDIVTWGLPPLRGVMHAAGTLSDGIVGNQNWPKLSSTFNTKVNGTLNLQELTKSSNLEHFVMFSSIAALFGPPGQCNHAAGNLFEDTLCHYRRSIGLPATTVNWGVWGEVGIATEVSFPGLKPLSNLQGITALEYTLKHQHAQLAAVNVDSFKMFVRLIPQATYYLDERVWKASGGNGPGTVVKSDEFWQQYEASGESEKVSLLQQSVGNLLKVILNLEENDAIDNQATFQELGVDSLMFIEIKNGLQSLFGDRVTVTANVLRDADNVCCLATSLLKLIEGESPEEEHDEPVTEQEVINLLLEDGVLPENISAGPGQSAKHVGDISTILFTGATGTLGPYLLKELTTLPQVTHVICLVRGHVKQSGEERLQKALGQADLLGQVDMTKVTCVNGNVALSQLGLEPKTWEKLSHSVDAVFHCAAFVSHVEQYQKSSKMGLRETNIGGTKNVLEFCCTNQLKHVFYTGALSAVGKTDSFGNFSEDWPRPGDFDGVTRLAYQNSKFVGDLLLKQAVDRGIPCKSFRFPFVTGHSKTGKFLLDQNHLMLRYIFIMKNGIMPSTPFPVVVMPVDICSKVSIQLFFNENAPPSDIYNISHHEPCVDQQFIFVAKKFGVNVEAVEFEEFAKKVRSAENEGYAMFKNLYNDDSELVDIYTRVEAIRRWIDDGGENKEFWRSKKIVEFIPDFYDTLKTQSEYITMDLTFAKGQGWF